MLNAAGLDASSLGTGQGGVGAGGGYSARSTTLQNVGLYGSLPTLLGAEMRGRSTGYGPAGGRGKGGDADDPGADPNLVTPLGQLRASGASAEAAPTRYRRRVADYFQRLVDDSRAP